jgi:hypothetical protein
MLRTELKHNGYLTEKSIKAVRGVDGAMENVIHHKTDLSVNENKVSCQHIANIKSMALSLSSKKSLDYFNQVILCADIITEDFLLWVKECLALRGRLIQIYTDIRHAHQHHSKNEQTFGKYITPTHHYFSYYQSFDDDGIITLRLFDMRHREKRDDMSMHLIKTQTGLTLSTDHPYLDRTRTICIDRDKGDALQFHIFLINLTNGGRTVDDLMDAPVLPYIGSMCRWEKGCSNCEKLETVIIGNDRNVKPCWNGEPVGKVGMSRSEILDQLKNIRREKERSRGCATCEKNTACTRCIFPGPLSEGEYCHLKRAFATEAVTKVIRHLDILKEI